MHHVGKNSVTGDLFRMYDGKDAVIRHILEERDYPSTEENWIVGGTITDCIASGLEPGGVEDTGAFESAIDLLLTKRWEFSAELRLKIWGIGPSALTTSSWSHPIIRNAIVRVAYNKKTGVPTDEQAIVMKLMIPFADLFRDDIILGVTSARRRKMAAERHKEIYEDLEQAFLDQCKTKAERARIEAAVAEAEASVAKEEASSSTTRPAKKKAKRDEKFL